VTTAPDPHTTDDLIEALGELIDALHANTERNTVAVRRANRLIEGLRRGMTNTELVESHDDPLILELTRQNLDSLNDAGSRVRRAQVLALHEEGMSTYQIAAVFGVSRQRISQIIQAARRERRPASHAEGGRDDDAGS
jgi:DNA-directed RNA polymerase specialized sigma24 family protein